MSLAWEITLDDVENILKEHGINSQVKIRESFDIVIEDIERIEEAVLSYSDFEEQVLAANSEIEAILAENGILTGELLFAL